ncbi:MAG: hypothetical protein L0338_35910 [Acidobacteria bacterium]|nr:hypothetical protein [Acidobacteriota bacterium]
MNSLEIKYHWADVQSSQGVTYRFPEKVTDFMKEKYTRPAVYRWTVRSATLSLRALYVGETDNLVRRVGQYLSPGARQATNLRLKAYFDAARGRDERIELQAFEFEPFEINKVQFTRDLLGHSHVRKMLENFILAELYPSVAGGLPVILNQVFKQDTERSKKREDDAVAALKKLGLTDEQIVRVTQAALISKTKPRV